MRRFIIEHARFDGSELVGVWIRRIVSDDIPSELYESEPVFLYDVVSQIMQGDHFDAVWPGIKIPVEVILLPRGYASIQVVQQGQPDPYRSLSNLPVAPAGNVV